MSFGEKRIERVLCVVGGSMQRIRGTGQKWKIRLQYYAKMKEIHQEDRGSKKQGNVVSKGGTLLTDSEDVKERW